jgi:membrane-associated phospholipid phosphatase
LADWISNGLVAVQVGADTVHSWRAPDRGRAFLNQSCRMGVALGSTALAKWTVKRYRPDGSNDASFWSGHTSTTTAAAGWRFEIGIPIAAATGLLRGGAAKHYLTDVGIGALDGALAIWVCRGLGAERPAG